MNRNVDYIHHHVIWKSRNQTSGDALIKTRIILPQCQTDRTNGNQTASKLHLSKDCHLPVFFLLLHSCWCFVVVFSLSVAVLFCSQANGPFLRLASMRLSKSRTWDAFFATFGTVSVVQTPTRRFKLRRRRRKEEEGNEGQSECRQTSEQTASGWF